MKKINYIILSLLLVFAGFVPSFAQVDAPVMEEVPVLEEVEEVTEVEVMPEVSLPIDLIAVSEFKTLMKSNKNLIIIDASKSKKYKKAHIANAIYVNHNKLYKDGDVKGVVLPVDELATYFGKLGINEKSEIVLYDGGKQKYSSRLYWILKYIGAEDVKILHQDPNTWKKSRIMLTSKLPKARKAVTFTPNVDETMYASTAYVETTLPDPNVILIDVRSAEEYNGDKVVSGDKKGHIPGSINIDYLDLETAVGAFKSVKDLEAIAAKYGITPDKELIFLCKTSIRGAVAYVAFKNVLGYKNVKLYDGACAEWCTKHPLE